MKTDYCTFYPEGQWSHCCYVHDADCLLAYEYRSAEMRLVGDLRLRKCVAAAGYPVHAWIMYIGVRAWYWAKWRLIDGIGFKPVSKNNHGNQG